MSNMLFNRLQELYAKWESREDVSKTFPSNLPRVSLDGLRRAGKDSQNRRIQSREQSRKIRERSLFRIKRSESADTEMLNVTSHVCYCCESCTPYSRDSFVSTINMSEKRNGVNILIVNSKRNTISNLFSYILHICSLKKYQYPLVTDAVLNDEKLQQALRLTATEVIDNKEEQKLKGDVYANVENSAENILIRMQSTINDTLLKITAWILYKILPRFVRAIILSAEQMEILKQANDSGIPIAFFPLHRSHLDYIIISFIILIHGIRNPLIAAGDNLRIPIFGYLLKGLGAFFIKRRIDPTIGRKDILYRTILHTYVKECLRVGHNIECFLEGGRTRTGKPCMPKAGILSIIIDAYMSGVIKDAIVVPMSINYERLVDGNFVREQLGQPKPAETFKMTIRAICQTLMGNFGTLRVHICQPFSLNEIIQSFQAQQTNKDTACMIQKTLKNTLSTSSLYGTDVVIEEHRQLVKNVARHIIFDSAKSMSVMSTNAVAFILLNKFRAGCTFEKLVESFEIFRRELEWDKKDMAFNGKSIDVVRHALTVLGPKLVLQQQTFSINDQVYGPRMTTFIKPATILSHVIELTYYSNSILPHYIIDSVIVTAVFHVLKIQVTEPKSVDENDVIFCQHELITSALKLCDILKYEFIFCKPCQKLEHVLLNAIMRFKDIGIFREKQEACLEDELWSKRYAHNFDDSSEDESLIFHQEENVEYMVSLHSSHLKRMLFLHTLLRPLVDTYSSSAFVLKKVVGRTISERNILHEIVSEIKRNLNHGIDNYDESLCMDPMKNSIKLFEKWNVLNHHLEGNVKVYFLNSQYNDDLSVGEVYQNISAFKINNQFCSKFI